MSQTADFIQAIETAAAMDNNTYQDWALNSFNFAKEFTNNKEIIEANRALFNTISNKLIKK